jgi:alditol oxidase
MRNWSGNVTYGAARILEPSSVDELRRMVATSPRIRALGTRHSFSTVADTGGDLVSLACLPPSVEIAPDRATVTVAAGMRYGDVAMALQAAGFALHNLGSLPHISVAGACATGTHGSGNTNGNLATAVAAIELVDAAGDVVHLRRGDADFDASVIALGTLGIVTRVTLDIEPAYDVSQWVFEDAALDLDWFGDGYSVSAFTDFTSDRINQFWVKRRGTWDAPATWRDAIRADGPRHPIARLDPTPCTPQMGVPGPWHERLPHFRLDFTPSVGEELQTEYFVARADGPAAVAALAPLRASIVPLLAVSELRTIAADELLLSPAYRRDSLAIHFTWIDDVGSVTALLPSIEALLAPFAPRPHWGKVFTMPVTVDPAFGRLRARRDPDAKFGNDFTDRYAPVSG